MTDVLESAFFMNRFRRRFAVVCNRAIFSLLVFPQRNPYILRFAVTNRVIESLVDNPDQDFEIFLVLREIAVDADCDAERLRRREKSIPGRAQRGELLCSPRG